MVVKIMRLVVSSDFSFLSLHPTEVVMDLERDEVVSL